MNPESAVNWFRNNNMIVNPDEFQLMFLQKSTKQVIQEKLLIDSNEIKSENLVSLLGNTIAIAYLLMNLFKIM